MKSLSVSVSVAHCLTVNDDDDYDVHRSNRMYVTKKTNTSYCIRIYVCMYLTKRPIHHTAYVHMYVRM